MRNESAVAGPFMIAEQSTLKCERCGHLTKILVGLGSQFPGSFVCCSCAKTETGQTHLRFWAKGIKGTQSVTIDLVNETATYT